MMKILTVAVLVAALLSTPDPAAASARGGAPPTPVLSCANLSTLDFSDVPGAPAVVDSARTGTDQLGQVFCEVRGVIRPHTHFAVKLPTVGWRGQYVQQGCGGLCGALTDLLLPPVGYDCQPARDGRLVLATDDTGHSGDPYDGRWGRDDFRARVEFGLTSEHRLAQLAKALIARFYGRPATHAYFDGCSTGGRQALTLAQRYPGDFDGIIAGAPASNMAPLSLLNAWQAVRNTGADNASILTPAKLPALHAAVLVRCGRHADGRADAPTLITDPHACDFQPESLRCPAGTDTASCLTDAQIRAVRDFYRGPTDRHGHSLYNGGQAYGSELGWQGAFVVAHGSPADAPSGRLALNYLKYLAYPDNPPESFRLADVQFTERAFADLNVLGDALYNANDPDLSAFRRRGGKLLMYHGWADPAIPAWSTIDYYAAVERAAGGFTPSQRFSRLYLIPGAYHCLFGPDTSQPTELAAPELLTPLLDWVERGIAPGAVVSPTLSVPDYQLLAMQTVRPYDALAQVAAAPTGLNSHYHYVGHY
jgi:hypothetical protein